MYWPLVLALADFVPFDDVGGVHLVGGFGIDLPVLDAIAGIFVDLMEADLFSLGGRRKQRDGARDEGQLEVAFPHKLHSSRAMVNS